MVRLNPQAETLGPTTPRLAPKAAHRNTVVSLAQRQVVDPHNVCWGNRFASRCPVRETLYHAGISDG